MKPRFDILSDASPEGLEVFQLTDREGVHSCHIYPEAQVFTPDSRQIVLHCHANPHGGDSRNPLHQYLLCDLSDNGKISPLTDEPGVTAPALSQDGRYFYYFVNQCHQMPSRLLLKRLTLRTGEREILTVIEGKLPGSQLRIRNPYVLSTIRSDGKSLALAVFLGDGRPNGDYGLVVFDLVEGGAELILRGPSWCNIHPQYCRSTDPDTYRDILIQENHGCVTSSEGAQVVLTRGPGCDIHVIRDDGTDFRTLAWGRDEIEQCRGHQCWRGTSTFAIGSVTLMGGANKEDIHLMEGEGFAYADHLGRHTPGAVFNQITRHIANPRFDHFATDRKGDILIADGLHQEGWKLCMMKLGKPGTGKVSQVTYLLDTKADISKPPENFYHPHPFFSPDGKLAFFNSNASGTLQAYMIRNLPSLEEKKECKDARKEEEALLSV